jgi:hypothetical protein
MRQEGIIDAVSNESHFQALRGSSDEKCEKDGYPPSMGPISTVVPGVRGNRELPAIAPGILCRVDGPWLLWIGSEHQTQDTASAGGQIDLDAVLLHQHKFHPMLNQACQEILEVRHIDPPSPVGGPEPGSRPGHGSGCAPGPSC